MRLKLLLSEVKPNQWVLPKDCPTPGCKGKRYYPRQAVEKKVMDAEQAEDFPFLDVEANPFDGGEVAVFLREVLDFENH